MSAVPRLPKDLGYAGIRMTADEFFALGETDERFELIDGVLVMSPSPQFPHQQVLRAIMRQLEDAARRIPGLQIGLDVDVQFTPAIVYRPDISLFAPGRLRGLPARLTLVPDVVVEILSPSSRPRDLITKREDYERFGVGEYWVFDLVEDTGRISVRCWRRGGQSLVEVPVEGTRLVCQAIAGLELDLASLLLP